MTNRTKEEQQLLDEKIARIQKKNEEILRRQKEIEEDKRLAEQQNALVKLKPSSTNLSRERTPALKPSHRELREDFSDDTPFQEPVQRSMRSSFRGRGGERFRGQGDWKTSGPPPDPKSFLHDDERDAPPKDRGGKEDLRRKLDKGRREDYDSRDDYCGGREFQRGGGRGDYRGERGRRGGRRGSTRSEEDAWRAERMLIDEARIQRQRAADGKWRREWDNEKLTQNSAEEPRYDSRRPNSSNYEQWRSSSQHQSSIQSSSSLSQDSTTRRSNKGPRGGRGRGRLDRTELEMPIEKFQIETLQKHLSSPVKSGGGFRSSEDTQRIQSTVDNSVSLSPISSDQFKLDPMRTIECVGNTVKISIPNQIAAQATSKLQHPVLEPRGRFSSHTSYSSQSDDDSPRDRSHRRQRNQKHQKNQSKRYLDLKTTLSGESCVSETKSPLPAQNKPPLPPFRSDNKILSKAKDGDESWEDVTTSGTESMGEELSLINSSPIKITNISTFTSDGTTDESVMEDILVKQSAPEDFISIEPLPLDYSIDKYLSKIDVSSLQETDTFGSQPLPDEITLQEQQFVLELTTPQESLVSKVSAIDFKNKENLNDEVREIDIVLEENNLLSPDTINDINIKTIVEDFKHEGKGNLEDNSATIDTVNVELSKLEIAKETIVKTNSFSECSGGTGNIFEGTENVDTVVYKTTEQVSTGSEN